jgi:hypothetical protein
MKALEFSVTLPKSFDKLGQWLDQHGGNLSIQNMIGSWHVTVEWCCVVSHSDKSGTHKETWSVSRHGSDFADAVRGAIEEAMSQTQTQTKIANEDRAHIENYKPLHAWLNKHNARCAWQVAVNSAIPNSGYVECWLIGNKTLIITVSPNRRGWEIFTTASDSNEITSALADIEKRLGLPSDPTLALVMAEFARGARR